MTYLMNMRVVFSCKHLYLSRWLFLISYNEVCAFPVRSPLTSPYLIQWGVCIPYQISSDQSLFHTMSCVHFLVISPSPCLIFIPWNVCILSDLLWPFLILCNEVCAFLFKIMTNSDILFKLRSNGVLVVSVFKPFVILLSQMWDLYPQKAIPYLAKCGLIPWNY